MPASHTPADGREPAELDRSPEGNVGDWLRARAALHPDRPAVRADGEPDRSYAELNALANRCAAALLERGVEPGDRVALALTSRPIYLALYFAAAKIGAILIPLNTRLTAHELAFQLADAEPRVHLREPELPPAGIAPHELALGAFLDGLPAVAGEPALAPGGEAPQVLMYTSGTTGRPKGALLPHRKTLFNSLNAEIYFGLREGETTVVPVPLFHSFGLKILSVPTLFAGGCVVLLDRFDPIELQTCVSRQRAAILGAVPVMFQRMVRAGLRPDALACLRFAFTAGAPIDVATIEAFHAAGVALKQGFGQTETSILACLDDADVLRKAGSVGRPVRHGEVRVVDPSGRECGPGEQGEIVVRGPIVMLGYWRRPDETEAARLGGARGWHRTGDLAVRDEEGFLTLVGRLKDLYISGGENVYPAEVERVLEEHPAVREAAVVGVPDPEWGEAGRAFVAVDTEVGADELLRWAGTRLARYKLPREFDFVDALPRTPSGKVQKHRLLADRA